MTKVEYTICDNCKKKIEFADACGYGVKYKLEDAWCNSCGGKHWDFCSYNCLKEFVLNEKDASSTKEVINSQTSQEGSKSSDKINSAIQNLNFSPSNPDIHSQLKQQDKEMEEAFYKNDK